MPAAGPASRRAAVARRGPGHPWRGSVLLELVRRKGRLCHLCHAGPQRRRVRPAAGHPPAGRTVDPLRQSARLAFHARAAGRARGPGAGHRRRAGESAAKPLKSLEIFITLDTTIASRRRYITVSPVSAARGRPAAQEQDHEAVHRSYGRRRAGTGLGKFPALAGGYRGGYHGGGYHHHHGGGGGSGWWVGGALALAATGLILAANSGPSYVQTGVYAPGVSYYSPPVYAAPVYEAPPVYSAPRSIRRRRNTRRYSTNRRRRSIRRRPAPRPIASAGP